MKRVDTDQQQRPVRPAARRASIDCAVHWWLGLGLALLCVVPGCGKPNVAEPNVAEPIEAESATAGGAKAEATASVGKPNAAAEAAAGAVEKGAVTGKSTGAEKGANAATPAPQGEAAANGRPSVAEHDGLLVRRITEAYERVRLDLYEGDFASAKRDAIDVGSIASERRDGVYSEMVDAARFVTQQRSIEGSREAFQTLSRTLWAIVADTPVVAGAARGYLCPGVGH